MKKRVCIALLSLLALSHADFALALKSSTRLTPPGAQKSLVQSPLPQSPIVLLEQFMKSTPHGQAQFTQTTTLPPRRDAQPKGEKAKPSTRTSSGAFAFIRPKQFRFDYTAPYASSIIADGNTLWIYDPELAQASARPQAQALASTPAAALLTAGQSLAQLRTQFTLSLLPAGEIPLQLRHLRWVRAEAKTPESAILRLHIGLRQTANQRVELQALEIFDSLAQRTLIQFTNTQSLSAPAAQLFRFTPPAGVNLLRE